MKLYKPDLSDVISLLMTLKSISSGVPNYISERADRDANGHHGRTADFINPNDKNYVIRVTIESFENGAPSTEYINAPAPEPTPEPTVVMEKANA